jgi:hypothetical protein
MIVNYDQHLYTMDSAKSRSPSPLRRRCDRSESPRGPRTHSRPWLPSTQQAQSYKDSDVRSKSTKRGPSGRIPSRSKTPARTSSSNRCQTPTRSSSRDTHADIFRKVQTPLQRKRAHLPEAVSTPAMRRRARSLVRSPPSVSSPFIASPVVPPKRMVHMPDRVVPPPVLPPYVPPPYVPQHLAPVPGAKPVSYGIMQRVGEFSSLIVMRGT